MRIGPDDARQRFEGASVARLATVEADGRPHLVPICFCLAAGAIYSAVDDKPKTTVELRRLTNVQARPDVAVLVDHYADDWSTLWWVRARGKARVLRSGGERDDAVALLREKYPQYRQHALDRAVLAVDVQEWRGWAAN